VKLYSGHVVKRGKSYRGIIELGRDANGKRPRITFTHRIKREADAELARRLNELNMGLRITSSKMTTADYLARWLRDYASTNVSAKTYQRYKQIVEKNIVPALGHYHLASLTPLQIQDFYSWALTHGRSKGVGDGLSPRTVLHFHRVLHKALGQAVRWQLLNHNPADAVEPPKVQRAEMKYLASDETARLLRELDSTPYYLPALIASCTGMRRGEVLGLRWSDVDLDGKCLYVRRSLMQTDDGLTFKSPKSRKGRRIDLGDSVLRELRRHKARQAENRLALGASYQDNDLVVCRDDGSACKPDTFTTAFRSYVHRRGFNISFHSLRHSHATQLLERGINPKVISERLGHANISITLDIYSHVTPTMQEEAASVFDSMLDEAMRRVGEAG